ncbi:autotransporter outer membrane beta-barrel domain-containing protein [Pseudomonas triclosanedens]|uniref:autotransporter family protein n=1 Tax=Pseudomonas triclosanedens TaxID=2961893 RepID=UPI0020C1FE6B|nr:autotransporter outer membrane beta-barrel domain-containing protein [Pseudomonas triclosanedens]
MENDSGVVGSLANGSVTVQGTDGSGTASRWINNGDTYIGLDGNGALIIINGGNVRSVGTAVVAREPGSTGTVIVSGPNSLWDASAGPGLLPTFQIGMKGAGMLQVNNGGEVRSEQALLGTELGGMGQVTVTDAGSSWTPLNNIYVGFEGVGDLSVREGGSVATEQTGGGAATVYVGYRPGAVGSVTVSSTTGNVSRLSATDDLQVGVEGVGIVTVEKGGLVHTGDEVRIGTAAGGVGTVHLKGDASGRGVIETAAVEAGPGAATLDLDGGILRANKDEADFLKNIPALIIGSEGAWFDSNSHDIGIATAFSGNSAFNKLGAGTLTLSGNSTNFTGDAQVQAGTLQVDGTLGGTMNVLSGARLTGIGQVGTTTSSGIIAPGHPGSLGTLTIAGDYAPSGGAIEIRTQLKGDDSPTDRLVITGSTSGTTPVRVTNFGGAGAQTAEGIRIIEVGGASSGVFTLLGNYTYQGQPAVVAGAYAYRLYQGSTSASNDGNWYLRSSLDNPVVAPPVNPPVTPPSGPLLAPTVPLYESYASVLQRVNELGTMQQRVGNRYWQPDAELQSEAKSGRPAIGRGAWVRAEGTDSQIDPSSSTSKADYDVHLWKFEAGFDAPVYESDAGTLVVGPTMHYGTANSSVSSMYGDGSIDVTGYGFGGTATWYGNDGTYVDGQATLSWYDSDLRSSQLGKKLEKGNRGNGAAASVEVGRRVALDDIWSVTPQAQLSWSQVRFDSFTDDYGAKVSDDNGDSVISRLGVSLDRETQWISSNAKTSRSHIYGIANLYYDFANGTSADVDELHVKSEEQALWGGLGVGGSLDWDNGRSMLFGELLGRTSLQGFGDSHSVGAKVGVRVMW